MTEQNYSGPLTSLLPQVAQPQIGRRPSRTYPIEALKFHVLNWNMKLEGASFTQTNTLTPPYFCFVSTQLESLGSC